MCECVGERNTVTMDECFWINAHDLRLSSFQGLYVCLSALVVISGYLFADFVRVSGAFFFYACLLQAIDGVRDVLSWLCALR